MKSKQLRSKQLNDSNKITIFNFKSLSTILSSNTRSARNGFVFVPSYNFFCQNNLHVVANKNITTQNKHIQTKKKQTYIKQWLHKLKDLSHFIRELKFYIKMRKLNIQMVQGEKRQLHKNKNVTLMNWKTFLYLICILLKFLLSYYFLQNCRFGIHIIKGLVKHHQWELKCHLKSF